ncbi:hypothetical protein F5144DRAFT_545233 [Chaetomium tenue]|uniref:Uncharacterized protein n=1 Tax=Chaetomium tenue TaxID=1854479 RepID=A0ACB7PH34_9PEZI|nr:hypothetical protein F5144DRAFT_545233 [Chaetomium globosum]
MPSWNLLRAKLQKASDKLQQWPAMVKRGHNSPDETSQGSRGPKQKRLMTTTNGAQHGSAGVSTLPAISSSAPHSTPANTVAGISENQGSLSNPIDLTKSPSPPPCLPDGSIDSPIQIGHTSSTIPSAGRKPFRQRAVATFNRVRMNAAQAMQIENDRRTAEILQQQLYDENEVSPGQDQSVQPPRALRTFVHADPLVDFRNRLRLCRCTRCRTAITIKGATLIQRTGEMLKQSPAPPSGSKLAKPPDQGARLRGSTSSHSLLSKGTGYGDNDWDWKQQMSLAKPQSWKTTNDETGDLTLYFQALSLLLPSTSKATTAFDREPQPLIPEMIQRSPIMARASELLRHGAIEEINQRCRPIVVVLDFMEALAGHESTCSLLFHPRILYPAAEQLPQIVLTASRTQKLQNTGASKHETSESLAAVAEQLAIPARKFVEASRRVGSLDAEYEKGESLVVLKRICSIADSLEDLRAQLSISAPQEPSSPPPCRPTANVMTRSARANAAKEAKSKALKVAPNTSSEWHRENCLKGVSDDIMLHSFHFAAAAKKAGASKPAAGRMRKLLAQVLSLSTDLPDGIYVRHGESRMDVMKVLIVGPPDTPYEHGLFEFDLFCGPEFPKRPPEMFFRTTGGGTARFNPNLYVNGKRTWRGQPWDPNLSTLLQLLVSIQAMIFNDLPYYNEPGYELRSDHAAAQAYNRTVERLTVQYAMIPWLADRLVVSNKQTRTTDASPANKQVQPGQQIPKQTTLGPPPAGVTVASPPPWADIDDVLIGIESDEFMVKPPKSATYGNPTGATVNQSQPNQPPPLAAVTHSAAGTNIEEYDVPASGDAEYDVPAPVVHPATPGSQPPPGGDDPIFGAVAREHFRAKASSIVTTVQKWEKLSTTGAGMLVPMTQGLENLLHRHGLARAELLQKYKQWKRAGNARLPIHADHAHETPAGCSQLIHRIEAWLETIPETDTRSAFEQFQEKWKAYTAKLWSPETPHREPPPSAGGQVHHGPWFHLSHNPFAVPPKNPPTKQFELLPAPLIAPTPQPPHGYQSFQAAQAKNAQPYWPNLQFPPPQLPPQPKFEPLVFGPTGLEDTTTAPKDLGVEDMWLEDTGAEDTGAKDIWPGVGKKWPEDFWIEDTGPEDTGAKYPWLDDTAAEDAGAENAGAETTEPEDIWPGLEKMWSEHFWLEDVWPENTGPENTGPEE